MITSGTITITQSVPWNDAGGGGNAAMNATATFEVGSSQKGENTRKRGLLSLVVEVAPNRSYPKLEIKLPFPVGIGDQMGSKQSYLRALSKVIDKLAGQEEFLPHINQLDAAMVANKMD